MPNRSKEKGNRFERYIVTLCEQTDIPAKRAWGSNGMSLGLPEEVDVLIDSDVRVQAKCRHRLPAYILPSPDIDMQVIKQDRRDTMVVMRFDDWLTDYRRLMELEDRLEDKNGIKFKY